MNAVPKVAHVVISLQHGGLEQCAIQWCHARNRMHPRSTAIVCLSEPGPLSETINDVTVFSLGANRSQFPWDRSAVMRLREIIAARDIEVLHSHNTAARQYASLACRKGNPKHIYTDHGSNIYLIGILNRIRLAFMKRRTNAIVAVSSVAAEALAKAERIPVNSIPVIMNGIAAEQPEGPSRNTIRERWQIPHDACVIGYVGRLSHEKGVDRLIRAFSAMTHQAACGCATQPAQRAGTSKCGARLHLAARPTGGNAEFEPSGHADEVQPRPTPDEVQPRATPDGERPRVTRSPDLRLLLIGDGPARAELESITEELNIGPRVTFLGALPNARASMPGIDLFVLPSRSEGLPLALLEAMVESVPVATTNVGECATVLDGGRLGRLLPDDESEWPNIWLDLTRDIQSSSGAIMTEAARQHIATHYSIERTVDQYESLYQS